MKLIALTLVLALAAACGGGGGGGAGGASGPTASPVANVVSNVQIDDLLQDQVIPNEDLVVRGSCTSSQEGAEFTIKIEGQSKTATCTGGRFEITVPASEIGTGDISIVALPKNGSNTPIPGTGKIDIKKSPCNLTQDESAGSCVDRVIQNPAIVVSGTTEISGTNYTTSPTITVDLSTTQDARNAYIFTDSVSCSNFRTNNCHQNPEIPACVAITSVKERVLSRSTFTYTIPGAVSGVATDVAILFENGSQLTNCIAKTVTLDTTAPTATIALARSVTNDPNSAPTLQIPAKSDVGAGIATVEYGIGTSTASPELAAYTVIGNGLTQYTADTSSLGLVTGTNYYSFLRITDALGNVSVVVSPAWQYATCLGSQNLVGGLCVDKPISGAQLATSSGSVIGGNRFVTDKNLTLTLGTTTNAQKLFLFGSSTDCNTFESNNCHSNPTEAACVALTKTEIAAAASMSYNASHLSHGSAGEVAGIYTNGDAKSSCLSFNLELDNQGPATSFSLARVVTNDITKSPKVNLGTIVDNGNAGLLTAEYAVSSDGVSDDLIPFTSFSTALTQLEIDLTPMTVNTSVNYKTLIRLTDKLNQVSTWVSANWTYQGCTARQNLVSGACVDKDIVTPELLITSASNVGGNLFTTTGNITISKGTTSEEEKLFVFTSLAACNSHASLNCHIDSSPAGCAAANPQLFTTPSNSMAYNYSSLIHASAQVLAGYYANGEKKSACLSQQIELDNQGPSINVTLTKTQTRDPSKAPRITFNGGQISDNGNAGLKSLEYGISDNGSTPNLVPFTSFSTAAANLDADLSSFTVVEGQDYQIIIKATDNLDQVSTYVSPNFSYLACLNTQTLTAGECVDNPVGTPEIQVANATSANGNLIITTQNLTLSKGNTTTASKLFMFRTAANCNAHHSLNCHLDSSNPSCSAADPVELTPSNSMFYFVAAIGEGGSADITGYYTNNSAKSPCITNVVQLDTNGPSLAMSLVKSILHDPAAGPDVNSTIFDFPAGVQSAEYGISTDGTNPDIQGWTSFDETAASFSTTVTTPLVEGSGYYVIIRATDKAGNTSNYQTSAFIYQACSATQTLTAGECVDNPIGSPQLTLTNAIDVSGTLFVTTKSLVLSMGSTTMAKSAYFFASVSDCNNHQVAECYKDSNNPGCGSIGHTQRIPSNSMSYSYSSMTTGVSKTMAGYYANGSEISSCLPITATLDDAAPNFSAVRDNAWTTDMMTGPQVTINSGVTIADNTNGSGLLKLEYAISTDGINPNFKAYEVMSNATTFFSPTTLMPFSVGVFYYTLVRATDKAGNQLVRNSGGWKYTNCNSFQTTQANGSCTWNVVDAGNTFNVTAPMIYSGVRYVPSQTINIVNTGTLFPEKLYVFTSFSDCANYNTNNCNTNPGNAGCAGINPTVITPVSGTMSYTYPTSLINTPSQISAFYANGTERTTCTDYTIARNIPLVQGVATSLGVEAVRTVTIGSEGNLGLTVNNTAELTVDSNPLLSNAAACSGAACMYTDQISALTNSAMSVTNSPLLTADQDANQTTISVTLSAGLTQSCRLKAPFGSNNCGSGSTTANLSIYNNIVSTYAGYPESLLQIEVGGGVSATIPYRIHKAIQLTNTGTTNDNPKYLGAIGSDMYLGLISGTTSKVFKTDGSTSLRKVVDIGGPGVEDNIFPSNQIGSTIYFYAKNPGESVVDYYYTTGSVVRRVANTNTTGRDASLWSKNQFALLGGNLYFISNDTGAGGTQKFKIFKQNGSTAYKFSDFYTTGSDGLGSLFVYGSHLYFYAGTSTNPNASKLYRTDGTSIKRISNVHALADAFGGYSNFGGYLWYIGQDSGNIRRLFRFDGTNLVQASNLSLTPGERLWATSTHLYFSVYVSGYDTKLFRTNGTTIEQVTNISPGMTDNVDFLRECNGKVYFTAYAPGTYNDKVFMIDGTKVVQVSNINSSGADTIQDLACFNNKLYIFSNKLYRLETSTIQ